MLISIHMYKNKLFYFDNFSLIHLLYDIQNQLDYIYYYLKLFNENILLYKICFILILFRKVKLEQRF